PPKVTPFRELKMLTKSMLLLSAGLGLFTALPALAETTLRVAIPSDIRSTNAGVVRDGITDIVMAHVVEPLVAPRGNLEPGPAMAKSWTVSEDGRTYTFTLRDGAKFHNGAPVTSAEVKWSWERYLDPDTKFPCRNWFDGT